MDDGVYGVLSYAVSQRRSEIGVRMATRGRVLSGILGETATTSALGITIGGAATMFAASLIAPLLFGIQPWDPWTLRGVVAALTATTLIAGYLPGRRAASIDPVRALKGD